MCIFLVLVVFLFQWFYEQIYVLLDGDIIELYIKKLNILEDKNYVFFYKRKDGVKKLFNFLDFVIEESGSGSGESLG